MIFLGIRAKLMNLLDFGKTFKIDQIFCAEPNSDRICRRVRTVGFWT